MSKRILALVLSGAGIFLGAGVGHSTPSKFLVIGVIASARPGEGVALLKDTGSGATFAAREGQDVGQGVRLDHVSRDYVVLKIDSKLERVRVGEEVDPAMTSAPMSVARAPTSFDGGAVERHGNVVKVAASFRDEMVNHQLSKVMMQAAAVPHYVNGELQGFQLLEIDAGSIYEKVGLTNGDVVTSINGQPLSDVGNTIKMLHSLKDKTNADVTIVRGGKEQTMQIVVQ
jgi:type II secretion system protein C